MITPARMMKGRTRVLLPLFLALGCEHATAPEIPLTLPLTDRIVFQSDRADSLGDIFAMKLDGSDVRRLTRSAVGETCPSISPDGNWIAYYSYVGNPRNSATAYTVQLMRANGTDQRAVAVMARPIGCPLWSRASDAFELTYYAAADPGDFASEDTKVFDVAGQQIAGFHGFYYSVEAFSADGTEFLVRQSSCSKNGCTLPDLLVEKRDGTFERWLTGGGPGPSFVPDGALDPGLSPDGATVVFICRDGVSQNLYGVCTVKWDGTAKTQIASSAISSARFSPNGMRIVFTCGASRPSSLCLVDNSGANLLTWLVSATRFDAPDGSGESLIADWTPDGTRLVFVCAERKDICSMQSDVGAVTNLTQGQGTNARPSMARIVSQ